MHSSTGHVVGGYGAQRVCGVVPSRANRCNARHRHHLGVLLVDASSTSELRMHSIRNSECTYKAKSRKLPDELFRTLKRCGKNPLDGVSDGISETQKSEGRCRVGRQLFAPPAVPCSWPLRQPAVAPADAPTFRVSQGNGAHELRRLVIAQCVRTSRGGPSRASVLMHNIPPSRRPRQTPCLCPK